MIPTIEERSLRGQIEGLQDQLGQAEVRIETDGKLIVWLEARNAELVENLKFYALMQNYAPNQGGSPPSPVLEDCGAKARIALARLTGGGLLLTPRMTK